MAFKLFGGGSAGNAMVYNRGNANIFDAWGWNHVWQKYDELEEIIGPFEDSELTAAPEAFQVLEAYRQVLGWGPPPEGGKNIANGDTSLVGFYDKSIKDGLRSSVPRNFFPPQVQGLDNLAILLEHQVTKVLLEGKRAVGVEYVDLTDPTSTTQTLEIVSGGEVILSAGPYITPHLLMKSGIGPSDQLLPHGVPVVQNLPGVGKNYQNHLFLHLVVTLKQGFSDVVLNPPLTSNGGDFIGNWYSQHCSASSSYRNQKKKKKDNDYCDAPDMQTAFSYYAGFAHYLNLPHILEQLVDTGDTANLWTMLTQPKSTGTLRFNPDSLYPTVEANFLSESVDVDRMVEGVRKMRAVAASRPYILQEIDLSASYQTDEELADYVRLFAMGQYHPAGTCQMAPRSQYGVVNRHLQVYGIRGLRVVDSSIMPRIQNGNPAAPSMLIGYHAADLILASLEKKDKSGKKGKKEYSSS